jgi:hypothetical protein
MEKQYWVVWFTGNVTHKKIIEPEQSIDDIIKKYLYEMNKGEAKSDRLNFVRKLQVDEITYNSLTSITF